MKRTIVATALAVIVLGGAYLRLAGLGRRSLWLDEAMSATYLDFTPLEVLRLTAEPRGVHPPLYFLALQAWSVPFGDSEAALRGLSAACGIATILAVYCLTYELTRISSYDRTVSDYAPVLAAGLVALSPLQVHLGRTVRGYTLVELALVLAGIMAMRGIRDGRRQGAAWLAVAAFSLLACYAHHLAVLTVAATGLFVGTCLLDDRRRGPGPSRATVRWALLAGVLFAAGYLAPLLPKILSQAETIRSQSNPWPITAEIALRQASSAAIATFDDGSWHPPRLAWSAVGVVISLLIALAVRGGRAGWYLAMTGLIPPLLLAAFSLRSSRSIFHARYLCFAQMSWLIAAAIGAALVIAKFRSTFERGLVAALALSWIGYACLQSWDTIGPRARPGMRAAMEHVARQHAEGEPIVARTPYAFFGARYYLRGRAHPRLYVAEAHREGVFGSEHLRDDDLVTAEGLVPPGAPGIWLMSTDSYDASLTLEVAPRAGWILAERRAFEQDQFLERPVVVEHFLIESPDAGGPRDGHRHD